MSSPPRIGSGHVKTGFSTRSEAWPTAWLVLEPSKPQIGSSATSCDGLPAMIFVFERSLAVGSVPSIQMYSALNVTEAILCGCCGPVSAAQLRKTRFPVRCPNVNPVSPRFPALYAGPEQRPLMRGP